ncbi:MAG: hypothetical protein QW367_01105 [Candidatus Aenigmatarchaeota archaeon]
MRIAFIGKGGSGKSTVSALFVDYLSKNFPEKIILAVDADLNIHLARYLGFINIKEENFLSYHKNILNIKKYLIGSSKNIKNTDEFLKTTPPSQGVNIIEIRSGNFVLENFSLKKNNIYLMIVGTYQKEEIGTACYHVNLSIYENILNFTKDYDNFIVSDMVAGIDFFANTLFNSFDMFVLVVEPNIGNLKIYEKLKELAKEVKIEDRIFLVGNKILRDKDRDFILENFDKNKIIGFINFDEYLYNFDFEISPIDYNKIDENNKPVFGKIYEQLIKNQVDPNERLKKLKEIHLKYISKESIKKRFGDLSYQIDESFSF